MYGRSEIIVIRRNGHPFRAETIIRIVRYYCVANAFAKKNRDGFLKKLYPATTRFWKMVLFQPERSRHRCNFRKFISAESFFWVVQLAKSGLLKAEPQFFQEVFETVRLIFVLCYY